jgi:hypothetical protein
MSKVILDTKELPNVDSDNDYTYTLNLLEDFVQDSNDYDCYDAVQIKNYRKNNWAFVLMEVTASKAGFELGTAYLGGIEFGHLDAETNITIETIMEQQSYYILELIMEATDSADEIVKLLKGA